MYSTIFTDARFPSALFALDVELAETTRQRGCQHCGGRLDAGNYMRKPRGGPWALAGAFAVRHSFSCAQDGCRRRALPPSVRFLGRRVYLAAVVVLGAVLQQGPNAQRVSHLAAYLGVDRRTLSRWRRWWLDRADGSSGASGLALRMFMPPIDRAMVPRSILDRFGGTPGERLFSMLSWLFRSGFSTE